MKLLFLLTFAFGVFATQAQPEGELILVHLFHRHGSKLPDVIDPQNAQIWEQFNLNPGDVSPLGITEFSSLGKMIRERYIDNEQFLSPSYNQNEVYIRASSFNPRPLQSSEAMARTLYPDQPVIIYTEDPGLDTLLSTGFTTCPSYVAGIDPRHERFVSDVLIPEYGPYMANLTSLTGYGEAIYIDLVHGEFCTFQECPGYASWLAVDGVDQTILHGFSDTLDPYFIENANVIPDILTDFEASSWTMDGPDDPRGSSYNGLAREIIQNMEDAVESNNDLKLINYSIHSVHMMQLQDAFGIPPRWPSTGHGFIIELRRRVNGEYYVRGEYIQPEFGGESYTSRVQPLPCPTAQAECNLDDYLGFLSERNPLYPPDGGCCLRTQDFFDSGCGDYLNPDVLQITQCFWWRTWCPQTACGPNQIVDRATLLCVEIS